jgi:K+-transporting ATPase ATPase C chain
MSGHLRANLWLLGLTLLVCCVLYPLVLWGVGKTVFPQQAAGSLIEKDGSVRGSTLIGQPFTGAGYFQPRPSSAGSGNGYNAAASGGSNWGPGNVKLRDRAARILGTNARYKSPESKAGKAVGEDIEQWFADRSDPKKVTPGLIEPEAKIKLGMTDPVTVWAFQYPTLASSWIKSDPVVTKYVEDWPAYKEIVEQWRVKTKAAGDAKPKPEDLALYFFASFARTNPGKWPVLKDQKTADGKPKLDADGNPTKAIELFTADDDLRATFFEMWFQETKPDLQKVPADMVLGSGSGLDPHITKRNAEYQAPRVITQRAADFVNDTRAAASQPKLEGEALEAAAKKLEPNVKKVVDGLIAKHAETPMWGLVGGDPLLNVLELNLALDAAMKEFKMP